MLFHGKLKEKSLDAAFGWLYKEAVEIINVFYLNFIGTPEFLPCVSMNCFPLWSSLMDSSCVFAISSALSFHRITER